MNMALDSIRAIDDYYPTKRANQICPVPEGQFVVEYRQAVVGILYI